MKRILCIVGAMNLGGAETFLMKMFRAIDKENYMLDFLVFSSQEGIYEKEIVQLGGRIYHTIPKSKNFIKALYSVYRIVKVNKYKYIFRISQHSLSTLDLYAAKLAGASVLIFRSSNSNAGKSIFVKCLHYLFRSLAIRIPTIKIAPSSEAAEFMYGRKHWRNSNILILKNGIDSKEFAFDEAIRDLKRRELGLCTNFVIGHIGRFIYQKNQIYLLDIFSRCIRLNSNFKLVLIGCGPDEDMIKEFITNYHLAEHVVILHNRRDIAQLYSAFDLFVFPSLFEGLPNVLIEAQASNLPCIVSNSITKEVCYTNRIEYLPLGKENIDLWVRKCIEFSQGHRLSREQPVSFLHENRINHYDINETIATFIKEVLEG